MSGSCFGSSPARDAVPEAEPDVLAKCATADCPRRFLIIYGDGGTGEHALGRLATGAARHHKSEVERGTFPGVPKFDPARDKISVIGASNADTFFNAVNSGIPIIYLAYFGHSWTNIEDGWSALFVGEENAPRTNIGGPAIGNTAPVTEMKKASFFEDAEFRSFGCRSGYGPNPVAKMIADHLGITTYAYESGGGSLFTNDETLGKGGRQPTQADIDSFPTDSKPLWLIPINGSRNFRKF